MIDHLFGTERWSATPTRETPSRADWDVRFWHKADVPPALTNVCCEGKDGHDAGVTFGLRPRARLGDAAKEERGLGFPTVSQLVTPKFCTHLNREFFWS